MQFNPTNYPIVTPALSDLLLLRQASTGEIKSVLVAAVTNAASPLQVASNIDDLKEINVDGLADGAQAQIAGFVTDGDGGGGVFYYDQNSTATPDDDLVVEPLDGVGRWLRMGYFILDAGDLAGATLAANVVNASLNSIAPTGGAIAVAGSIVASGPGNSVTAVFPAPSYGLVSISSDNASGTFFAVFAKSNGTAVGTITRVGTTDAVSYNTTSDGRLKTNVRDFTESGPIIDGLSPRLFDWKSGGKDAIGFIAQEEAAVDPALARIGAVTVGDNDPDVITNQWQRSDAALIPILVAELKALRQRVAALEAL